MSTNHQEAAFLDRLALYEEARLITKKQVQDYRRRLGTEPVESLSDELGSMRRRTSSSKHHDNTTSATTKIGEPLILGEHNGKDDTMKIWEPIEWGEHIGKDETTIDTIFAEMCLFARLGHHQPPCCLPCGYYKRKDNTQCNQWVVWRKDAQQMLHPDSIGENIAILHCCGARRLLDGAVVDGRRWDAEEKQLRCASP